MKMVIVLLTMFILCSGVVVAGVFEERTIILKQDYDGEEFNSSYYYNTSEVYNKTEVDALIVNASNVTLYWNDSGNYLYPKESDRGVSIATGEAYLQNGTNLLRVPAGSSTSVCVGDSGNDAFTGTYNVVIGEDAGESLNTGYYNNFIGSLAGSTVEDGVSNVMIGYTAGRYNNGSKNLFLGTQAGMGQSGVDCTGIQNTALGTNAARDLTTGNNNFFLGARAGQNIESGSYNVLIGTLAGYQIETTTGVVGLGYSVFRNTVANGGSSCTGVGTQALYGQTTGSSNTAIGAGALQALQTGRESVGIGTLACQVGTSDRTVCIGYATGYAGGGDRNIFIGHEAGRGISTDDTFILGDTYGDTALLYGDLANDKLGIGGTYTPQNTLDVEGGMAVGASYSGSNTAPANGMIIEGDVGIGTNNPEEKLEIVDYDSELWVTFDSNYSNTGIIMEHNGTDKGGIYYNSVADRYLISAIENNTEMELGGYNFQMKSGNPRTFAMVVDENQYVGIGTTNPGNELHVHSQDSDIGITINSNNGYASGILYREGTTTRGYGYYDDSLGEMIWRGEGDVGISLWTDQQRRVTILNTSEVGIGTDSPGEELEVIGRINASVDVCITGGPCLNNTINSSELNNSLLWNDTGDYLKPKDSNRSVNIGEDSYYMQNGEPILWIWEGQHANLENTFIGKDSGTNSSEIYYDTCIGTSSCAELILGDTNTCIGGSACRYLQNGSQNTAIGSNALRDMTTGNNNIAIGKSSLETFESGDNNIVMGVSAMENYVTGSQAIAIGATAGRQITTGSGNINIGYQSGYWIGEGGYNTNLGYGSGVLSADNTSSYNVNIGMGAGGSISGGDKNVYVGHMAGYQSENDESIFIGYEAGRDEDQSNLFIVGDSYGENPLLRGDLVNDRLGIGLSADPVNTLDVEGNMAIGASYSGSNAAPSNGLIVEGNVSIGTSDNDAELDVEGVLLSSKSDIGTPTNGTEAYEGLRFSFNPSTNNIYGVGLGEAESGKYPIWWATGDSNGGGFEWYIGYDQKMKIDRLGNVGIGTSSPGEKLEVNGSINVTTGNDICIEEGNCLSNISVDINESNYVLKNESSKINGSLEVINITIGDPYIIYESGGDMRISNTTDDFLIIKSYGDVNITNELFTEGVTIDAYSPVMNIRAGTNAGAAVRMYEDGDQKSYFGVDHFTNSFEIITQDSYDFLIQTDSDDALYIDDNQQVGIGTTNPQNTLDVEGGMAVGAGYSGSNSAPNNGLIVEGAVELGSNLTMTGGAIIHNVKDWGTATSDGVNVSGVGVLAVATVMNQVTIGGFIGGVEGQILHVVLVGSLNNLILEDSEGGGNQDILLSSGSDETIGGGSYGGWTLYCTGNDWVEIGR